MSNVATLPREAEAPAGVIATMARQYSMDPRAFEATLRATVVPGNCTKEQFAAFLLVARQYGLNPVTKEIYAFPAKGGIQPVVSIDGWMNLCNSHPQMDGLEFDDHVEGDKLTAVTARIWRKDRSHPTTVTEYLTECDRGTEPWKKWPRRMLRHKAAIQCARYAFGFAGIIDPDEAERMGADVARMRNVTPVENPAAPIEQLSLIHISEPTRPCH
jgi:phage recombination protein Bet